MKKRSTFIFTIVLSLAFCQGFGQDKSKIIDAIRNDSKVINADTTLEKVVLNDEEFLDHKPYTRGKLTGFYKSGKIKKIVSRVGVLNGNEIFEFFFKDNTLILVFEELKSFFYDSKKQTFRVDTTETTFVGYYYFHCNKLIDQITIGHNRFEDDTLDSEKILLKEANKNKKLLDIKQKNYR